MVKSNAASARGFLHGFEESRSTGDSPHSTHQPGSQQVFGHGRVGKAELVMRGD